MSMLDSPCPSSPTGLSERALDVLRMLADGKTQAQIADVLYVSTHTVHDTLRCIYKVLGVRRQAEAVATAFRMGLID